MVAATTWAEAMSIAMRSGRRRPCGLTIRQGSTPLVNAFGRGIAKRYSRLETKHGGHSLKGAIATVDFFSSDGQAAPRRLSLVVAAPERCSPGDEWQCRVALADLYPAKVVIGLDSLDALAQALTQARAWLAELHGQGQSLSRDRAGETPFELL